MLRRVPFSVRALAVAAITLPLLSACGGETWFGESEDPPLPGTRISVLEMQTGLEAQADGAAPQIVLPPPEPARSWPQAGGLAHHAMQHMTLGDNPQRVWQADIGSGGGSRDRLLAQPIVAGDRVYTIDTEARVSAFDLTTGRKVWETDLLPEDEDTNTLLGAGLAYANGRIFAATGLAQVVALDAGTGAEAWRTTVSAPMRAAPTVDGGRVFVVTIDNTVLALAASDGRTLWSQPGVAEATGLLGGAAPAVDAGTVVAPMRSGELMALTVDTGRPLWSDSIVAPRPVDATANLADINARPVIDSGRVYVVSASGLMTAIDMRTGQRVWDIPLAGIEQPWVAGGVLYALSMDADLAAVDARTGRVLWVTPLPRWKDPDDRRGRILWSGPVLASDRLIIAGSHGEAMSVSPYTGKVLGRTDLPDGITLAPIVAQDTLIFLTNDADLVAYR
ncbi:PQQ-binding-like beta-propeller repeat protein [Caenispirillum salinarum]|uniref:outer membrane protein assembly factor BamB family protein n=1 Tax=Caenispirillum salinarum TaxID=859058 RepID=UPI0038508A1F